jgi:hypothetical protein
VNGAAEPYGPTTRSFVQKSVQNESQDGATLDNWCHLEMAFDLAFNAPGHTPFHTLNPQVSGSNPEGRTTKAGQRGR